MRGFSKCPSVYPKSVWPLHIRLKLPVSSSIFIPIFSVSFSIFIHIFQVYSSLFLSKSIPIFSLLYVIIIFYSITDWNLRVIFDYFFLKSYISIKYEIDWFLRLNIFVVRQDLRNFVKEILKKRENLFQTEELNLAVCWAVTRGICN